MNDFSDIENDLRKLRPAQPSPVLFERIEEALAKHRSAAVATQVVYNTRDEGLQFTNASPQPVRRLRYHSRQTWQWRNPTTGASLRVSYPSEEVVLIPVSGQ